MFMSSAAHGRAVRDDLRIGHFPLRHLAAGAFALVAMGAVFGAASRATFSFIIFAFEITRDYNSVLPLMLVAVIADGVAMLFMPKHFDHDGEAGAARPAHSSGLRSRCADAGYGRRDDGERGAGRFRRYEGRSTGGADRAARSRRWRGTRRC